MSDDYFPRHYGSWKVCITQKCNIPLTKEYVQERIQKLSDADSKERQIFVEKYGEHWTKTVLGYFKEALNEV